MAVQPLEDPEHLLVVLGIDSDPVTGYAGMARKRRVRLVGEVEVQVSLAASFPCRRLHQFIFQKACACQRIHTTGDRSGCQQHILNGSGADDRSHQSGRVN